MIFATLFASCVRTQSSGPKVNKICMIMLSHFPLEVLELFYLSV